jgi:hypothetical protein
VRTCVFDGQRDLERPFKRAKPGTITEISFTVKDLARARLWPRL